MDRERAAWWIRWVLWASLVFATGLAAPLALLLSSWLLGALMLMATYETMGVEAQAPASSVSMLSALALLSIGLGALLWAGYRRLMAGWPGSAAWALPLFPIGCGLGWLGLVAVLSGASWA